MGHYRLVADHGSAAAEFDAVGDDTAEFEARVRASGSPTTKRTGYRLERLDGETWVVVRAWMTQQLHRSRGGLDDLIDPTR